MRHYLSHGMGVNSTALMLILIDEGIEFESVFCDTGCEKPKSYEYLDMLVNAGYRITRITPHVEGFDNLYDYCWHYQIIPLRNYRVCTSKFKTRPLYRYIEKPSIVYIGFGINERRRAKGFVLNYKKNVTCKFPLIEKHLTRQSCKRIIRSHGLPVPVKSGCWLCPFQSKRDWIKLRDNNPELFQRAIALEQHARSRDPKKLLGRQVLASLWQEDTLVSWIKPDLLEERI